MMHSAVLHTNHSSPLSTTSSSTSIGDRASTSTCSSTNTMASSSSTASTSESEEAVLLRDWDFERFFPANAQQRNSVDPAVMLKHSRSATATGEPTSAAAKSGTGHRSSFSYQLQLEDRVKSEIFANNAKANQSFLNLLRASNHKAAASIGSAPPANACIDHTSKGQQLQQQQSRGRPDSAGDARLSNFVRGFRRENSDFFPLTKRHSAILGDRKSTQPPLSQQVQPQRSSGIFVRSSGGAAAKSACKGEPILTEYVSTAGLGGSLHKRSSTAAAGGSGHVPAAAAATSSGRSFDLLRPRREKTESVILVRNTATRQHLLQNMFAQQVNEHTRPRIHAHTPTHTSTHN